MGRRRPRKDFLKHMKPAIEDWEGILRPVCHLAARVSAWVLLMAAVGFQSKGATRPVKSGRTGNVDEN